MQYMVAATSSAGSGLAPGRYRLAKGVCSSTCRHHRSPSCYVDDGHREQCMLCKGSPSSLQGLGPVKRPPCAAWPGLCVRAQVQNGKGSSFLSMSAAKYLARRLRTCAVLAQKGSPT